MLFSSLAFGQPSADAAELTFAKDEVMRPGESCPEGTRDLGWPADVPRRLAICRPDGFFPVASPAASKAVCDQAVEAGVFGVWFEGDPVSVCLYAYSTAPGGPVCSPATIKTTLFDRFTGEPIHVCASPVLVRGLHPPASSNSPAIAICINDDVVLASDAAANLGAGSEFQGDDGLVRLIISGQYCGFNCVNGWDVNCDGKLGDFCPAEFDRRMVAGVKSCLAALNTSDPVDS